MNEEEIVQKVAEQAPDEPRATPDIPGGSGSPVFEDPGYVKLYNWFGIEGTPDPKVENQIKSIYQYAKNMTDGEWHNVLWAVRSLENRLGSPSLGEKRHNKLYGYVLLMKDRANIEHELQSYERPVTSSYDGLSV